MGERVDKSINVLGIKLKNRYLWLFLFFIASPQLVWSNERMLSPLKYGLYDCVSDIQRYYVLQEVHNDAAKLGFGVDYAGIDSICIEIPRDAEPLQLADHTDFGGVVLNIINQAKNFTLFKMSQLKVPMDITWSQIVNENIPNNYQDYLIIIEDQEPWTHRIGYSYDHIRKDILLVKNGQIINNVVSSYGTASSKPRFSRTNVNKDVKVIKNLTINRDAASTYITNVLSIENQNDVEIQNVTINTLSSMNLYGDAAISITNCTNVRLKDITIDGTYSQKSKYGYGICLNNVWNISFDHLIAHGNWGVFGNNNVNMAHLENCDINRFDIHCYGRDVTFRNCTFRHHYNQFSSIYGTISFDHCQFVDFLPVLFEPSYNAYTGFDLIFRDCTWELKKGQRYLIQAGNPFCEDNKRKELKEKCWPNLSVSNMKVVVSETVEEIYLYGCMTKAKSNISLGYVNYITIKNMSVVNRENHQTGTKLYLSDKVIGFKNRIKSNVLFK